MANAGGDGGLPEIAKSVFALAGAGHLFIWAMKKLGWDFVDEWKRAWKWIRNKVAY